MIAIDSGERVDIKIPTKTFMTQNAPGMGDNDDLIFEGNSALTLP